MEFLESEGLCRTCDFHIFREGEPEVMAMPMEISALLWEEALAADLRGRLLEAHRGEAPGGASWATLVGYPSDSLLTTYTLSGTTGGETTQFRVRAKNPLGWGPWSDITSVAASAVPA